MAWKDLWSGEWDRQMGRRLHQSDIILLKKKCSLKQKDSPLAKRRQGECASTGVRAYGLTAARQSAQGRSSCRAGSAQRFLELTGSHGRIPSK